LYRTQRVAAAAVWCASLNVIEDRADELWIGDVNHDPQLSAAARAERDIDFEHALEWYVTRRCTQVNGAVDGSLQSPRDAVGWCCRVAGAVAEPLSVLRWRAFAEVGTIAPWFLALDSTSPGSVGCSPQTARTVNASYRGANPNHQSSTNP
jgi:hypothetical protein